MRLITIFIFLNCLAFSQNDTLPYVQVLGVAQDGGYPHFGCEKECCKMAWKDTSLRKYVVALAIVDPKTKKWWLMEATPDIKEQIEYFKKLSGGKYNYLPDGIFITHAHIGHYAGLINLGREVMNTTNIPVYVMPKMKEFIEKNGPWSQLVKLKNIKLVELKEDLPLKLTETIVVSSMLVPHRDEFSETVGYRITTNVRSYLFIPDIDKWNKWKHSLIKEVSKVDIAFLDATFNKSNELQNRAMSEVPHPFVEETMSVFKNENEKMKEKIHFIHFNHTNALMWDKAAREEVQSKKFNVSIQGGVY